MISVAVPCYNESSGLAELHRRLTQVCGPLGDYEIVLVNDGSTDDSNKLGAIGDLNLVLKQERVDDDLIVVAGDNLFSEKLGAFGEFCRAKNAPVLGLYDVGSLEAAKKYGVVAVGREGVIADFKEKPAQPASTLIGIKELAIPGMKVEIEAVFGVRG